MTAPPSVTRSRRTTRGTRERLNQGQVVDAAVALADQRGIEALTMRNLSQALGVVPMALYKHVTHKEELLDLMVDRVFSELEYTTRANGAPWCAVGRWRCAKHWSDTRGRSA